MLQTIPTPKYIAFFTYMLTKALYIFASISSFCAKIMPVTVILSVN